MPPLGRRSAPDHYVKGGEKTHLSDERGRTLCGREFSGATPLPPSHTHGLTELQWLKFKAGADVCKTCRDIYGGR